MNFNEAKEYLYNRYKGNFTVSTDNVNFFSNGFYAMTFEEYGLYIYSLKLKKIEKYLDDELLALNEIKKNLLKTKVDQL